VPASRDDIKRYAASYRAESEAALLYERLAAAERSPERAEIFRRLAATEQKHVDLWRQRLESAGVKPPAPRVGLRARLLLAFARRFGPAAVLPAFTAIERDAAASYGAQADPDAVAMSADERSHARVFGYLSRTTKGMEGKEIARLEGRHRAGGANALRAAVLGVNDGLVSVFSLVMGVAGAGVASRQILYTGGAGLLAGALSMALGEWLSVQSAREMYANQLAVEKQELEEAPEEEEAELALIYQARGLDAQTAGSLAGRLIGDSATALDSLARMELGFDPEELGGSAWQAAGTSFLLFAAGALLPVLPYGFLAGTTGMAVSAALSLLGLFVTGAVITVMTGRNPLLSGLRQMLVGLACAAITFGIGTLVGAAVG
jgi:VIT1/CCC1 family predicted Fe2+/Mn2+ transporter